MGALDGARRAAGQVQLYDGDSQMADRPAVASKACSFCREEESQVVSLARVQAAFICDGCIDLCTGIVAEADEGDWQRWRVETIHDECSFCGRRGREVGGLIAGRQRTSAAIASSWRRRALVRCAARGVGDSGW